MRASTATALADARARTHAVIGPIPESDLRAQHSPLMSPLVWDLAHIAHYEELWLIRALGAGAPTDPRFDDIYDAFKHPRAERPDLDLLGVADAHSFAAAVRDRVLAAVGTGTADRRVDPLVTELIADDLVYGMVVRHEHQHIETMLGTLQLMSEGGPVAAGDGPGATTLVPGMHGETLVPAGPFVMGTDTDLWAYDNERPAHSVDLPAFFIDTTPATNAEYAEFVDAGGYDDPRHWHPVGWKWRQEAALVAPQFWSRTASGWTRRRFGRVEPLPPHEPVQHICWYEADAYARASGKRLPSEAEWEKAASWDPADGIGAKHARPWGGSTGDPPSAALWGSTARWGPDDVGAYPDGASPVGALDMLGGVWEWTASDFGPYPGFRSFPYREYSEVFFGPEYKVLRGGSWATDPLAVSTTFRNWDYPIRRQIFSGVRCARDA